MSCTPRPRGMTEVGGGMRQALAARGAGAEERSCVFENPENGADEEETLLTPPSPTTSPPRSPRRRRQRGAAARANVQLQREFDNKQINAVSRNMACATFVMVKFQGFPKKETRMQLNRSREVRRIREQQVLMSIFSFSMSTHDI